MIALSTNEAMAALARERVGLIISDMGRREEGRYVAQAGAVLLKAARQAGYEQPFIVYSSARYAVRNDEEIKTSCDVGATASATTLLEWISDLPPKHETDGVAKFLIYKCERYLDWRGDKDDAIGASRLGRR